ncbi:MAG: NAD-dependent epimerase/dehydratase family protein [Phycisphaeraceae bacterium]|nr:NAD-dependent epimerase/dehydratase family protein [Phycisphaeraceae bacterium]
MRTAIITGGAGFIGSQLARRLLADGRRVLIIDNLSTGRRENVAELLDDPRADCRLIVGRAGAQIEAALRLGADEVYHLAAAVGVQLVVDDPAGMIRNNVSETVSVLEAARTAGAKVLITSSSEVYGKCPRLPLQEDMDLVYGPTTASRWSYGLTKAIDEHLALDFSRRGGPACVVVRLFNTIGPRQTGRYGMVVPRFIEQAVNGRPLQVYGDGKQTRAFCDVRDVVEALVGLMAQPDAVGRVFNIGSTRQITIDQLAAMVIQLAGSSSAVEHLPYEAVYGRNFEDPPHRLPDTSRLQNLIGWQPAVTLEQTIRELIELRRGPMLSGSTAEKV